MTDEERLADLRLQRDKALERQGQLKRDLDARITARRDAFRNEEAAIREEFRPALNDAYGQLSRLNNEITALADKLRPDHPMEGRMVHRIEAGRYSWDKNKRVLARIETVRPGAKFASNLPEYRRPAPGAVIARHVKADGTLGLVFTTTTPSWFDKLIEQVEPTKEWSLIPEKADA